MKPLSVEMACLLGIQNEIQAVWEGFTFLFPTEKPLYKSYKKVNKMSFFDVFFTQNSGK